MLLRWWSARNRTRVFNLRRCNKTWHCTISALALCTIFLLTSQLTQASSNTAITDDFDLGIWSPFMSRVQKSIPVCIWNSDEVFTTFNVTITSGAGGNSLRMSNDIGDVIDYRVHWLSGNRFRQPERLTAGLPSRRTYTSNATARCSNGPTAMLRITVNVPQLNEAPPGIYTDTLQLTVSPL